MAMIINTKIYEIFSKIESEYKSHDLHWGNYLSALDWNVADGKLNVFVTNTDRKNISGSLNRQMSHQLRDDTIINALKMINVTTILDVGADTGLFLARCKYNEIDGVGIEPNQKAVDLVNKKNYIRLFCFDLQTLMRNFVNNNRFDVCSILNSFHGEWEDIKEKDAFARYISENFQYAVLSDDYKNNRPDPIISKYFHLVYDFNMYGMTSLREYKYMRVPHIKKYFKAFRENKIYAKVHHLSTHKLYITKNKI